MRDGEAVIKKWPGMSCLRGKKIFERVVKSGLAAGFGGKAGGEKRDWGGGWARAGGAGRRRGESRAASRGSTPRGAAAGAGSGGGLGEVVAGEHLALRVAVRRNRSAHFAKKVRRIGKERSISC